MFIDVYGRTSDTVYSHLIVDTYLHRHPIRGTNQDLAHPER